MNTNVSTIVLNLEQSLERMEIKKNELEASLQEKDEKITEYKSTIKILRLQVKIYEELLRSFTSFKPENIFVQKEDCFEVNNFQGGKIPVIVKDFFQKKRKEEASVIVEEKSNEEDKVYYIKNKKSAKVKKGVKYTRIKNQRNIEEAPENIEKNISVVQEELDSVIREANLEASINDIKTTLDTTIKDIQTKRGIYKKYLQTIKQTTFKLLGKTPVDQYIVFLKKQVSTLDTIFTTKKYEKKKITSMISESLTPLDSRLIFFGDYYNTKIEAEFLEILRATLKVNSKFPKRYCPFVFEDLFSNVLNYGLALFSLKENLTRIFTNPFGFFNVIYLNRDKDEEDPFNFYILDKIDANGKRNWKMECRLWEFSDSLRENIKQYCITLFRKIYFDIFSDNIYRENYSEKNKIMNDDGQQLLQTLLILSKPKYFCDLLKNVIIKNCTFTPYALDSFNFQADDNYVKKSYDSFTDENSYIQKTGEKLFDYTKPQELEQFWKNILL